MIAYSVLQTLSCVSSQRLRDHLGDQGERVRNSRDKAKRAEIGRIVFVEDYVLKYPINSTAKDVAEKLRFTEDIVEGIVDRRIA